MSKGSSFSHSSLGEIAKSTALISGGSAVAALIYYYGRKQALRWALENVNTQDKPHPMAVLVLRYLSPRAPKLYDMQEFLPLLPLPSVEDSMRKYLESIRPLVSEDQFRHTKQLVNEFVGSQEARELQAVLETKRETEPNWVAEWWMRFAYLYGRDPLPINVSFAGFDTIFRPAPTNNQVRLITQLQPVSSERTTVRPTIYRDHDAGTSSSRFDCRDDGLLSKSRAG